MTCEKQLKETCDSWCYERKALIIKVDKRIPDK